MERIHIVYWTGSGNTAMMANAIAQGVKDAGKETIVSMVSEVSPSELFDENCFALGCPAMRAEVLEENEMEPFVEELEPHCANKTIVLFGSYGWGDGQWMRDWCDRLANAGATLLYDEGIIVQGSPDDGTLHTCMQAGKKLAQL